MSTRGDPRRVRLLSPLAALLLGAGVAAAGEIDVSLAGSWLAPASDTSYAHSYTPHVAYEPTSTGSAGHTLSLAGEDGYGLRATLGVGLGSRLALELLLAGVRQEASGPSSPYAFHLEYTARLPPDYQPHEFTREREVPWPDAEARLRQLVLGLGLRARFALGPSVSLGLTAGPTLHRVGGEMESLAWTYFWFGGHSVLFEETYQLAVDLPSVWTPGLALGGELDLRLGGGVSLVLDARYFLARECEIRPEPAEVLNADVVVPQFTPEEIAAQLELAPARFDPSFFAASAGLRLRF